MPLLFAGIVPHPPIAVPAVGGTDTARISATVAAYEDLARRIAACQPETIVITSPHAPAYADYFHITPGTTATGDLSAFRAAEERFALNLDATLAAAIVAQAEAEGLPAGFLGGARKGLDHGVLIPLHFLLKESTAFAIVRIGVSGLPLSAHYRLGKCIAAAIAATGRRTVFVASGDLSHKLKEDGPYGYAPQGPEFDRIATAAMASADFSRFLDLDEDFCDAAAECGLRSFAIMAGALDGIAVRPELLSYEGPFGVGYGIAAFTPGAPDPERRFDLAFDREERRRIAVAKANEDAYVRLARLSLEHRLRVGGRLALPPDLPDDLVGRRAGAFVTLKLDGRLRGCIGTIAATAPTLAEEIVRNAVSAGTQDPRFPPVTVAELDRLVYGVDVLGPAEPVASLADLDPRRYGVIVRKGARSGLLLPDLEGVDTVAEQVAIARRKAGIGPNEDIELERFEVVRHP